MKMKLLAGAAVASVLAATGAGAQVLGWYGAIDIGGHHQPTMDAHFTALQGTGFDNAEGLNFRTEQVDYAGFARIGYRLTPNVRLEIEGGYRHGGLKSVYDSPGSAVDLDLCNLNSAAGTCGTPDGSINAWTGMANILFDILPASRIDPFIGGGVGAMHVKVRADGNLVSSTDNTSVHGNIDDFEHPVRLSGHRRHFVPGDRQAERRPDLPLSQRHGHQVPGRRPDGSGFDGVERPLSGPFGDAGHSLRLCGPAAAAPAAAAPAAPAAPSPAASAATPAAASAAAAGVRAARLRDLFPVGSIRDHARGAERAAGCRKVCG